MKYQKGLVVRRGQSLTIDVTLSRQLDTKNENIEVYFELEKKVYSNELSNTSGVWHIQTKSYGVDNIFRIYVSITFILLS